MIVRCFKKVVLPQSCHVRSLRPARTKPRTSHRRSPGGERRGKRDDLPRKDERAIVSQTKNWTRFKGSVGETSERKGGAHKGFSS